MVNFSDPAVITQDAGVYIFMQLCLATQEAHEFLI